MNVLTARLQSGAHRPRLADYRDAHRGDTILVCGCGESLNLLDRPERFITIGVNDVGRGFTPDYLVVLNPRSQFSGDRFRYVERSEARAVFTQLDDLALAHPRKVAIRLGRYGGTDLSDPDVLPYTQNSPYVALCLAIHMGARRIGLIGIDFTDNHFFGPTGVHPLIGRLDQIDSEYARLVQTCRSLDIEIVNLSPTSRLTALPKRNLSAWSQEEEPAALRIVSYATTPVAGVPLALARCIAARTPHRARCVWASNDYGNGVCFDGDVEWQRDATEAEALIRDADVVIVHNGKVEARHRALFERKAVVTMAHNYMWNVDRAFFDSGLPGIVVGQYQATLPEFAGWDVVPNPVPLWEPGYGAEPKPDRITLCYTPSGRHERYPPGHRLYWHAKGYDTTMRVLDRMAARFAARIETIRDGQVSHAESLAMKQRSHIVIDECVTGSYHRNSLEGLAAGCVVVNAVGTLAGVPELLRQCGGGADAPFVRASLDDLEQVLEQLVQTGPDALAAQGAAGRRWMAEHWDFAKQWPRFWMPPVQRALNRSAGQAARFPSTVRAGHGAQAPPQVAVAHEGVSVVIPHGGLLRRPHLAATLAALQRCRGISEIIVVDQGEQPCAEELARAAGAKYVFLHGADAFERARALNVGSALAEFDLLLWLDNDLLPGPDFVERAVRELRAAKVDYLLPYSEISYLSEADGQAVMQGVLAPAECRPIKVLRSGREVSGGAGLASRAFVERWGGLCEDFKGWGGEDNAWWYKAAMLGRVLVTSQKGQTLHHLYHASSGAHAGAPRVADNPHYARNVALLAQMRTLRDREQFLRHYPPPAHGSCPWNESLKIVFAVAAGASEAAWSQPAAEALAALYGIAIDVLPYENPVSPFRAMAARSPDALVCFGVPPDSGLAPDDGWRALRSRTCLVLAADRALRDEPEPRPERGIRAVSWTPAGDDIRNGRALAVALAQVLSLILAHPDKARAPTEGCAQRAEPSGPPVWMYWEGACPDWIRHCQRTVLAHGRHVRLLTPEAFDRLWDADRDIDLTRLEPAHRADFIRAFLLMRFGGIWIDSDCIVVKPLRPVLDLLDTWDFVAHRDRQGYFPNGFMAAAPGSRIAAEFYARICARLRSRRPIHWISLGGEPLTDILSTTRIPWREIPVEHIQPICWSHPEAFFAKGRPDDHRRQFNDRALCYMLSNTTIRKFQAANPVSDLLDPATFFSFLLDKSRSAEPLRNSPKRRSTLRLLLHGIGVLADIAPERVLILGTDSGRWASFIRDTCDAIGSASAPVPVRLEGIWSAASTLSEHQRSLFDRVEIAERPLLPTGDNRVWDAIVFAGAADHWTASDAETALKSAVDQAGYVLICDAVSRRPGAGSSWPLTLLQSMRPLQGRLEDWHDGRARGLFVLSRHDPAELRQASRVRQLFEAVYRQYSRILAESVSGPGSCLAQTAELRRCLPILLGDLGARSLIDAPCGDLNWIGRVELGVETYIGIDIVERIVADNARKFPGRDRLFLNLDIIADPLPTADIILCRDCLVHFSYEQIADALENFRSSGSTYVLMTHFTRRDGNTDIVTGGWRPLNFLRPPFNFPDPLRILVENCTEAGGAYADKSLALWRLADLAV